MELEEVCISFPSILFYLSTFFFWRSEHTYNFYKILKSLHLPHMLINGFCSLLQFFHMLGVYQVNWNKCGSWLPPDSQYLHEHLLANWVDSLPLEIATKQGPHAFQLSDLFHLVISQMEHVRRIPTSVVVDTAVYHLQPSQTPKQYSSFGQLAFGYRTSPVTSMNESVQRAGASEVVKITQIEQ